MKLLDNIYYRFKRAAEMFVNPDLYYSNYQDGLEAGKSIAYAKIEDILHQHDPYQFENNHFKIGYYYAFDQVKKVTNDEDNPVD